MTDEDRKKFAEHCLREVQSYTLIAEQMEKLPHAHLLVQRNKKLAEAYKIVHEHLVDCESFAVGGGDG